MSHATFGAPVVVSLLSLALSGCAVVETSASVVRAGASVVGTTVSAATSVAATTIDVGLKAASATATVASATVTAASAAKTVTVATASTAVAAGSLVVSAVDSVGNAKRADDVSIAPVVAVGPDRFAGNDGRLWLTKNCPYAVSGQPALWVAMRSGDVEIRGSGGMVCAVVSAPVPVTAVTTR